MKSIEVFDGNKLSTSPILYPTNSPQCAFVGIDAQKQDIYVPIDHELLSRHMMLLGGIGTGKTKAFHQIIRQLRQTMTSEDVMILFDTKGDFYQAFYQKGDVVISNDETACGSDGVDYWNIFNELGQGEHLEEEVIEISKALFHDKLENTSQPFFPMLQRTCLLPF